MKATLQGTTKPAPRPCDRCRQEIPDGETWFYNYRPRAEYKIVCQRCEDQRYAARLFATDAVLGGKR